MKRFKIYLGLSIVVLGVISTSFLSQGAVKYSLEGIDRVALELIGSPFNFGHRSPKQGFDSASLVQYVYEDFGVYLPRRSEEQWEMGKTVHQNDIKTGDVLFFQGRSSLIPGIYIEGSDFVVVTSSGVAIRDFETDPYWNPRYVGAKRYKSLLPELNPIAKKAIRLLGTDYKQGGNDLDGFNHSGLIQYIFEEIKEVDFPRTAREQWELGQAIELQEVKSGDVLFFQGSSTLLPGIYTDHGNFIVVTSNGVSQIDLDSSVYWKPRLVGARRFDETTFNQVEIDNPAVKKALSLLGNPYNLNGTTPDEGFNTTLFVRYVFEEALGIQLSVFADRMYEVGEPIAKENLEQGDIVFFQGSSLIPGIYKGNGIFIVQTTIGVEERNLHSSPYWAPRYVGAKRLTDADIYYMNPENFLNHEHLAVRESMKYIGTPYLLTGDTSEGFDCSWLVQTSFRDGLNVYLPRITYNQWEVGETVDFNNRQPGDVIYFSGTWQEGISHAGIYLGNNYMIHATGDEGLTTISYLGEYWMEHYTGVKRFDALSLRLDNPVVEEAYKNLGVSYLAGGNTEAGFDYSGFLQYIIKQSLNIDLPRYASQQWTIGKEIEKEDLEIGDALFFEGDSGVLLPGVYIGSRQFIIVTGFEGVAIRDLDNSPYWTPRYVGARRYESVNHNNAAVLKAQEYLGTTLQGYTTAQFVERVYSEALDMQLPRSAYEQWESGQNVPIEALESGDLVLFGTDATTPTMSGIYVGEGAFIILTSSGVAERNLNFHDYWMDRFLGARRFTTSL
ncbi:NlpC/P60 family protein [Serpentinicella sp. ANB-PHB4]|uniref:C40 family peptidase n=1 Tax=Serpentinicella sp. ANB-PHB4 TaxID=3074076 RepID=UPI0028679D27|nr:NlpC/P60 family protein [Serpentinicella sp. ANB-PHB4]MDR5658822.1 NlpC/P60 family protein [Serpentinicella sp. ANB-PHB4]